jgi:hypothetical protein
MNLKTKMNPLFLRVRRNIWLLRGTVVLGLLMLGRKTQAQSVLAAAPETSETPPALQPFATSDMDVFAPAGAAPAEELAQPFRYKFLTLRPHVDYQFLYGDGILVATNRPESTVIQNIAPGFRLDIGQHWTADYTPSWTLYSNNHFQNTFNQAAKLTGGTVYGNWVLGLSQTYVVSDMPQAETAAQTKQTTYATAVNGSYTINSKMSLDLGVNQDFVSADQFQSYREWSTMDWLNYHFWVRFDMALGVGLGYDDVDASPDMLFEQYQGRIKWRATDKISFQLHGGVEDRQFFGGNSGDILNPVFGGGIQYQPFEQTKISLNGDRVVAVSALQNQISESVGFDGDLNQRLLGRLYLDLSGGYQNIKYVNSGINAAPTRTDDYYYFNTRLSTSFLKRGTVAVFYQLSSDSSSQSGFNFSSHQVGFEIGFAY